MPEWLWAILIGSVLMGLIGLIWRAQEQRIKDLELWKRDKEKFDYEFRHEQYAPTIASINNQLLPLVGRVDDLRHFNEVALPKQLDQIVSDAYGTMGNQKSDVEKRLDRIERKVFNGHNI